MKKYLVDDAEYSVCAYGDGPIMMFAHGFPFDGTLFDSVVKRLGTQFYCVVPDLRGFGRSTLGANGRNPQGKPRVTMGRYADDLAILASEIACERGSDPKTTKIFLCGLSMGGYIALEFAHRRPDRLAGLVFCDSNANPDSPAKAESRRELADAIVCPNESDQLRALADKMIPKLLAPKTLDKRTEIVDNLRQMIERQTPDAVAAGARGMSYRVDSTPFLPQINVPTLVLGGEEDALSSPALLDAVALSIPGAVRATIPNAGHLPPLENPDAFVDAILNWSESFLS